MSLDNQAFPPNNLLEKQLGKDLKDITDKLDALELAWLSGYCWAKAYEQGTNHKNTIAVTTKEEPTVTVLSISQTGNAKGVAMQLTNKLQQLGVKVNHYSAKDYKAKNISQEQLVLVVTSTQGEGEVPEEGVVLYKLLHGKKAPQLPNLSFAVLGLGDKTYPKYCQAGKDLDAQLNKLGAKRLLDLVEADLDYQVTAQEWISRVAEQVKTKISTLVPQDNSVKTKQSDIETSLYHKTHPFEATLLTKQKITDRKAQKDVRHIELDLSGSDLRYQVGDALGVWVNNNEVLVNELLSCVGLTGKELVNIQDAVTGHTVSLPLFQALKEHYEVGQNSAVFVKAYAALVQNDTLNKIVDSIDALTEFVENTPLVGVFKHYPLSLTPEQLMSLLRPLTPRLYSIASSSTEVGNEEVHLTEGVVRYQYEGKDYTGTASGFLADTLQEDETVRVFIESNDNFRLPEESDKPIIMIASGTGIAPFRAFVQERAAQEAQGKNWLIFGNQYFTQDFLYQLEWQDFARDGFLHRYDFAWSRDQEEKIYVQHKILQRAKEIWQWLQEGAYIYVCGDASRMAKDVEQALLQVIAEQGQLNIDDAEEYLMDLRENKRYQRDVY